MCNQVSVAIFTQLLDTLGVSGLQRPMNDEQAEKLAIKLIDIWTRSDRRLAAVYHCLPAIRNDAGRLAKSRDHCHRRAAAMVIEMGKIAPDNIPMLSAVVESLHESLDLKHDQASA